MSKLLAALAFTVCFALPQPSPAEVLTPTQSGAKTAGSSHASQLPGLLQRLGANLISKARAAECTEEGEACTSNEQCCSGLECTGSPPAVCAPED